MGRNPTVLSETDYKFSSSLIYPRCGKNEDTGKKNGARTSSIIIKHLEERFHQSQNPNFKTPIPSRRFPFMETTAAALGRVAGDKLEVLHDNNNNAIIIP